MRLFDIKTWNVTDLMVCNLAFGMIFVMGLWAVDTGASAMFAYLSTGEDFSAVGLFGERSAIVHYHIGMVTSILSFLLMSGINIVFMFRGMEAK